MKSSTRAVRLREKSARRRAERKADTRRAILEAATALFLEQGFEKFSLRQVAEAIGYSATTIYLYFNDKDDLLFHVAMEGFKRFGESLQAGYAGADDPLGRLKAIGKAYVEFGLANPVNYRLMFMQRGEFLQREPPEGYTSVIDSFGILLRTLEECMRAGLIEEGDLMTYAAMVWTTVHGLVALAISTPYFDERAISAVLERSQHMIVDGIRRRK